MPERIRRTPRSIPLRPCEIHLLKTGEETSFFVFDFTGRDIDRARDLFERARAAYRGAYPLGTFPWAERKFQKRLGGRLSGKEKKT